MIVLPRFSFRRVSDFESTSRRERLECFRMLFGIWELVRVASYISGSVSRSRHDSLIGMAVPQPWADDRTPIPVEGAQSSTKKVLTESL
jgi:hypothetical protein